MFRGAKERWLYVLGGGVLALLLLIQTQVGALAAPSAPRPGSGGDIQVDPSGGPVDTRVGLILDSIPPSATTYMVEATTTSPDQGGCATAKPISGAVYSGFEVDFQWPASLPHGVYWFCAKASGTSAPFAQSTADESFTALTDAAPSLTLNLPQGQAQVGTTVTLTVSHWVTSDHQLPVLALQPQGSQTYLDRAMTAVVGQSDAASGSYTLTVSVPNWIQPGRYSIVGFGECTGLAQTPNCYLQEQTSAFALTAGAALPTIAPIVDGTPVPVGVGSSSSQGSSSAPIGLGLGALLLVLIGMAAATVIARRRTVAAQADQMPTRPMQALDPTRRGASSGDSDEWAAGARSSGSRPTSRDQSGGW